MGTKGIVCFLDQDVPECSFAVRHVGTAEKCFEVIVGEFLIAKHSPLPQPSVQQPAKCNVVKLYLDEFLLPSPCSLMALSENPWDS